MNMIESIVRDGMITFLVQKQIFCPVTGNLLDRDTCAVMHDADGDPVQVFDPSLPAKMDDSCYEFKSGWGWYRR